MILKSFSSSRANKLSKAIIPTIEEPLLIRLLWLQYEDFGSPSEHFTDKLHKHTFFELHFILEGNGVITDRRSDYTVSAGDAIIVPQRFPHAFKHDNKELKRFSIAFTLPEDISSSIFYGVTAIKMQDHVIEDLNAVFDKAEKCTVLSLYSIRNRIFEILCDVLSLEEYCTTPSKAVSDRTDLYVDKSKKYIEDNLNVAITCKDVADYCHINEIYLNRLFKRHTEETLSKYIRKKRLDYSMELLKNKELSLSTVSVMLGFSNEYYFNAFFKKAVGMPPGAYRKLNLS